MMIRKSVAAVVMAVGCLLGGCTDGTSTADDHGETGVAGFAASAIAFGSFEATTVNGVPCQFTVNGAPKGTSSSLKMTVMPGTYGVSCRRTSDGQVVNKNVVVSPAKTTKVSFAFADSTTIVAVAVGGKCQFFVNGAPKGISSNLKISGIQPGAYNVLCKPTDGGPQIFKETVIGSGQTAMFMFNLND